MKIITLESGPLATRCYIVYNENFNRGVIIDAPYESTDKFLYQIEKNNLVIKYIILTHSHWDHVADASKLKEITGAEIAMNQLDEYRAIDPMKHTIFPLDFEILPFKIDFYLEEDTAFLMGEDCLEVICTPGHTEGGISLVERRQKVIFSGDTIFKNGIGRVDFPGGNYDDLIHSIKNKLFDFPDDFVIYPGHGMPTTILNEKQNNPFLK